MENKILFINAGVREESRTVELSRHLLELLGGTAEEVNLYEVNISPIGNEELKKRSQRIQNGDFSCEEFKLAKQFAQAGTIVIAAPFWDLSFPSILKVYFENIAVSGITFSYSEDGRPVGKCSAEKLYYITTSGGYIGKNNFGFDYIEALAENFFGIEDVCFLSAEGLDIYGADVKKIMQEAKEKITALISG